MSAIDTKAVFAATSRREGKCSADADKIAACFPYTDRASYLGFVAEWKAIYAALSADIRAQKRDRADHSRNSRLAFGLLALRTAAKADSWAKRQALRAAEAAAIAA
jgi:hypothetical protein